MKLNYVLIDYENVKPELISALNKDDFRVILFVGANQSKISTEIVLAMRQMGERSDYVRISGNGSNALDFHIAYYIGSFAARVPDAFFHIISKDTGFDPLIAHLKGEGVLVCRSASIAEIPLLKMATVSTPADRADLFIERLKAQTSKPRALKTLRNHIHSLFQKKLTDEELDAVVNELQQRKFVILNENKVTYAEVGAGSA